MGDTVKIMSINEITLRSLSDTPRTIRENNIITDIIHSGAPK